MEKHDEMNIAQDSWINNETGWIRIEVQIKNDKSTLLRLLLKIKFIITVNWE